jgi:hypothetical protein
MKLLVVKATALLLLSAGYVMASSANSKPNLAKNTDATKFLCDCGGGLFAACPSVTQCSTCCGD